MCLGSEGRGTEGLRAPLWGNEGRGSEGRGPHPSTPTEGWKKLLDDGGEMFLSVAGAMSSAELGISMAKMIRAGKVHAICATERI